MEEGWDIARLVLTVALIVLVFSVAVHIDDERNARRFRDGCAALGGTPTTINYEPVCWPGGGGR